MPDFCAAYGCSNERSLKTRARGITFHLFPKTGKRRSQWELALRRDGFVASDRTLLCSEHFRSEDFDRTGQTVRLKDGVVPSIFNFPAHLQRTLKTSARSTTTPRRAEDDLPMDLSRRVPQPDVGATGERSLSHKRQATDHLYSLPACPKAIKAKLEEASARVRKLQREKSNALKREKRTKMNMQALLEKLKEKNLINEELKDNLECYSDLPVHLLSRRGVEYTKAQREFALTLHLIGPKAYHYLRDTLHIHLPHPSSLQRWVSSLDARGHVTAQDDTESLPAVIDTSTSLSAVDLSSAAGGEDLPSPFADVPALVHDHRSCGQRSRGHFRICCSTGSEEAVL